MLQRGGVLQRLIPAAFQCSRDKAVFRLGRIVLTLAAASFEAGPLKLQLKLAPLLRPRISQLTGSLSKRLHPHRRQRCEDCAHDRLFNLETAAQAAELFSFGPGEAVH